jgi:formylglycine-generating enzyme required for sulfatase activity
VPGGTFARASGDGGAYTATVSSFRLDEFLVTVGRFRQFVAAVNGGYVPPPGSGKHTHLNGGLGLLDGSSGTFEQGWAKADSLSITLPSAPDASSCGSSTWTVAVGFQENLPINCISWYTAYAFCIWDGGFLPTEAEWQYAAVGGSEQRVYPWGIMDPTGSSAYAIFNCDYGTDAGLGLCPTGVGSLANVAPVGSAPEGVGLWSQRDLAGEVFEWTLDYYAPYVPSSTWTDSAYLTPYVGDGGPPYASRVLRGGDFEGPEAYLEGSYRAASVNSASEISRSPNLGVRCARTPAAP